MYEYIPNAIIEGSLRAIITAVYFMALTFNNIWSYADIYYFGGIDEEDYIDKSLDSGEITNIGWEYEYQDVLTTIYNYFFVTPETETDTESDEEESEAEDVDIPVSYENKYNDLWKTRSRYFKKNRNIDTAALKNNILIEQTPFGNVIMFYDDQKNSFVYYCDKTLSYPIINSVGRKYALTFGCEELYIDKTTAPEPPATVETKIQNVAPQPPPSQLTNDPKKNLFVKFKNYKNPPLPKSNAPPVENVINRYTCEGKLSNFSFLKKAPKVKQFSYKDFKNKLATK